MKKRLFLFIVILLASALALAGCGGNNPAAEPAAGDGQALERPDPPADYAGKTNPHDEDAAAAEQGKAIYQVNCASCHGESGEGDGPAASALDPKPQNLAENQADLSDAYLLWRISEGGQMEPFYSAMPAWKGILSEDQIWQVITYLHTLQ